MRPVPVLIQVSSGEAGPDPGQVRPPEVPAQVPGVCFGMGEGRIRARDHPLPDFRVTLGVLRLLAPPPDAQVRGVASVTRHPAYRDGGGGGGDLALARLDPPARSSRLVRPVCVPPPGEWFGPGTNCTVTGWGHVRTAVPLPPPKTLQQVEVPLLSQRHCHCLCVPG
ncbi:PREDICTED: prostasin [Pseudopodoces humilis]|uniref:prostasin n=1 Tax=Pseudopodoces humilis TaxID=181119 RepID=UPI0006B7F7DE|nr:PREDICTED: prostasin [Pseudopodoces humilis]